MTWLHGLNLSSSMSVAFVYYHSIKRIFTENKAPICVVAQQCTMQEEFPTFGSANGISTNMFERSKYNKVCFDWDTSI